MLFTFLSLVIVLGVIASIGKSQLKSLSQLGATTTRLPAASAEGPPGQAAEPRDGAFSAAVPGGLPGAAPAQAEGTVPMQAQALQNRVRDAANAALQQGANRNSSGQP